VIRAAVPHGDSLSASGAHAFIHAFAPVNPSGANELSRDLTLATWHHANVHKSCIHMAPLNVHGKSNYDAHRLPAGKTAAERRKRDVLQFRLRNCPKFDDIDYPRHHPSF